MFRLCSGIIGLSLLLFAMGCDESTLGPETRGDIQGQVQDADTNAPLSGVNITTSPPTSSIVTGADGAFEIADVETGNYTLNANKSGYDANTVTVSVQEGKVTQANIFLQADESATEQTDSISVSVLNWSNRVVSDDTTFVDVEYRVRNAGEVPIADYEVYFRIDTTGDAFFYEVSGDSLQVKQADIGQFEKYIRDASATEVTVDGFFFEGVE